MNLIAIEPSTRINSITLARGNDSVASVSWDEREVARQHLFIALPKLLQDNAIEAADIDQFVLGSGPGAFSGIRIAIAACQGLAQPSGATVSCIPSTDVVARGVIEADAPLLVVGDARRKKLWCAEYRLQDGKLTTRQAVHLIDIATLPNYLTPQTKVVSPDADRLEDTFSDLRSRGVEVTAEPVVPCAADLAALVLERLAQGEALAPPVPTYLHPAVFVAPRFPAAQRDNA